MPYLPPLPGTGWVRADPSTVQQFDTQQFNDQVASMDASFVSLQQRTDKIEERANRPFFAAQVDAFIQPGTGPQVMGQIATGPASWNLPYVEISDSTNMHSPTDLTNQIRPHIRGWYRVAAQLRFSATSSQAGIRALHLRKNNVIIEGDVKSVAPSNYQTTCFIANALVEMNGTSDFFDFLGDQGSTGVIDVHFRVHIQLIQLT